MQPLTAPVSRLDYCQYLLSSQINYTLTNFAEHTERFSHEALNRYLADDHIPPRLVWENVRDQIVQTPTGYLVFDDPVVDKRYSFSIDLVRRQYSGNAHGVIKGIGVVTCVYVHPELDRFWIVDYRIYDPDGDGKSKLDHVADMPTHTVYHKQLAFRAVLMDTWYATIGLMQLIESLQKIYYCPIKDNRQVDDTGGQQPYQRTDYVVTNDMAQISTPAVLEVCGWRWKIEQFHRETKQVTGIEGCQCRKARIVRNHIGCAILVWVCLKQVAHDAHTTIYQVKHGLLSDYLRQQLKSPTIKMVLA